MDEAVLILQELGLTHAQSLIYFALLRQPQAPAQLSRKTGLHRRSIIATLRLLAEKGLVKKQEGLYHAAPLAQLHRALAAKQAVLLQHLPQLSAQYETTKDTQTVNLLMGIEGVKSILADEVLKGKPIMVLFGHAVPAAYKPHFEAFDAVRVKQHIPLSVISAAEQMEQRPQCEMRFIREFKAPMEIHVYANKVAVFVWDKEPIVISIKRDEITQCWKTYFGWLWGDAQ